MAIPCSKPNAASTRIEQNTALLRKPSVAAVCVRSGVHGLGVFSKGKGQKQQKTAIFAPKLAPREGFEPPTKRLTAACSTAELPGNGGP